MENLEEKLKKELEDCSNKFYATIEQIKQLQEQAKAYQITYAYLKKLLPQSAEEQKHEDVEEPSQPPKTESNPQLNTSDTDNNTDDLPDYLKN